MSKTTKGLQDICPVGQKPEEKCKAKVLSKDANHQEKQQVETASKLADSEIIVPNKRIKMSKKQEFNNIVVPVVVEQDRNFACNIHQQTLLDLENMSSNNLR